jgi:hypothetical protein
MSYAINSLGKTVDSFWKTNQPERIFGGGNVEYTAKCAAVADRRYSGRSGGASPHKHVFLRNEPELFVIEKHIYPAELQ